MIDIGLIVIAVWGLACSAILVARITRNERAIRKLKRDVAKAGEKTK